MKTCLTSRGNRFHDLRRKTYPLVVHNSGVVRLLDVGPGTRFSRYMIIIPFSLSLVLVGGLLLYTRSFSFTPTLVGVHSVRYSLYRDLSRPCFTPWPLSCLFTIECDHPTGKSEFCRLKYRVRTGDIVLLIINLFNYIRCTNVEP